MRNYEALLVDQPEIWADYIPVEDDEEADIAAETELNFEE